MNKVFKRIVSVTLAVMCLLSFSGFVFAAEEKVTINGTEYEYGGELLIDEKTEINCDPNSSNIQLDIYYTLNAPQDGYYSIGYGTPHAETTTFLVKESALGGPINYTLNYNTSSPNDYFTKDIYYLETGKYILSAKIKGSPEGVDFRTEYLGASVTEYSFKYDMILVSDIETYGGQFNCSTDAEITFSSGKVLDYFGNTFGYIDGEELVNGENNLTVNFCGNETETTATVHDISYYIEGAQLSNAEYYLEQMATDGDYIHPTGETVTIYFTDGTTRTVTVKQSNNYVTLPNGREYPLYFSFGIDLFRVSLSIYIDGNEIEELTHSTQGTPSSSFPFSEFSNRVKETIEEVREIFDYYLNNIDFSNPESLIEAIKSMALASLLLLNIPADFFMFLFQL